ncbi:MAG: HAD family phosphatase [Kiritimatiellae bacterium]|nr:HAD family phosphatase [Kiritimatiellia bacterium]
MAKQAQENEGALTALFFEMENAALGARGIRYEVLAGILKEQKIGLEPVEFSRWCLGMPEAYMAGLLKRKGYTAAAPEQVIERLRGETLSRLMQKDCVIDDGLAGWLDAAAARKMSIVAVTALPQEAADGVAGRLHFEKWGVKVLSGGEGGKGYCHPESWIRAAKAAGRLPQSCLAVATGAGYAQAALTAGCAVVAVPDRFTEFEDFSGAMRVCGSLKELDFAECIRQSNY